MPQAKLRPSEVAAEAKKAYIPYVSRMMPECAPRSFLHIDSSAICVCFNARFAPRLRVAVIDGDPVDVALGWYESILKDAPQTPPPPKIPIVNMANEKRPGGDWESGLMAPEECLARRSNLVATLRTPWTAATQSSGHYPIPQKGGIYSPSVVIFRDGPERYDVWKVFKSLPVISVAPVRRPKLDQTGMQYSFTQERELMMEKMRTILRIAAAWKHKDICLGAFGAGPIFKNPAGEIAKMWKTLLFHDEEFCGAFSNVVFAIDPTQNGSSKGGSSDADIFRAEFDPSNIFRTAYR